MIDEICKLPAYQHTGIIFAVHFIFLCLDTWMNKTDKTKSGSVLEFVYNLVKDIFAKK